MFLSLKYTNYLYKLWISVLAVEMMYSRPGLFNNILVHVLCKYNSRNKYACKVE
jgi:hypothetical protein